MLSLSIRYVLILISLLPTCVRTNIANFSSNLYQSEVLENQPIGTRVLQLFLQTNNSLIRVSLQGHLHSHFLLSGDLVIHSAAVLDRETTSQYELTAVALYNSSEVATANVSISIEDVNDNAPYCNDSSYSVEVNETYLVDSLVVVQCWDRDVGRNASLEYQLQNNYSTFSINSTGNLVLSQPLDYEQYPDGILLQVIVSDQGDTPFSTFVYVFVDILSVNEFAPQFSDSMITHRISEHTKPGSRIVKISASDMDSGRGGEVFYFLSPPEEGLFHLDLYSGGLYLLRSLDYESHTSYSLLITASNSPIEGADSLNTSAQLELTVLDIREDLRFETDAKFTTLSEDFQTGDEITRLVCGTSSASDPPISYAINNAASPVSQLFRVDSETGAIYTRSTLDYENQSSYEVPVSCSCCSSPSLKAYASLFLSLADVNEFPPVFSPTEYQLTLSEQTQSGTDLLQLSASDQDTGSYGQVQYRLLSHEQMFYLHPTSGTLYLRGTLNYNTQSSYNVTVLAGNSYPPRPSDPLNSTAIVLVSVTEYFMDKPPECALETQLLALEETTAIGQHLAQFSCNNNDSTSLSYSLNSNYSNTPFYVYSNGTLSLQDYLDFELGSRFYLLEIRATQTHSPFHSSPIFLHVIVTPVNEYRPVFNQTHYSLPISELTSVGTNILNVSASDKDSYPDGGVRFTLIADFNTFSVDPISGYIYLVSLLDYDAASQYNLSIVATDHSSSPLSGTANLLIYVTNENTLPPSCYPTHLHATLPETTPPQSQIAQFSCSDPDGLLIASELLASLSSPIDKVLTVFNSSLVLTSSLDYELVAAYTGVLLVTEPNSTFSFQIAISLLVEPYNEFSPHFRNLPYTLSINSSAVWTLSPVFSVAATDLDAGRDGEVVFYLQQEADQEQAFQIDFYTGDLWLVYPIQLILNDSIELTVIAEDQSLTNRLANSSTLSIYISRDIPPSCQSYFHSFSVPENTSANSILLRLHCMSPISYKLNDEVFSERFSLTSNGSLLLTLPLDAETRSSYFSSVHVLFSHNTTLMVGISISVEDVNEFAPSFVSPPSYYDLTADVKLGSLLLTFQAIDADLHNQVEYSLTSAIPGLYLSPDTGILFLSSRDIFSLSSPISVSVTAKDSDPHPMKSTTKLLLNVSVSNVTLSPKELIFLFSVREDELVGSLVGTVQCVNAFNLSYELQNAASSNFTFSVNRETGDLVLTKTLNFEENRSYALEMTCASNSINMSAQFITVVTVKDINEYPPTIQPSTNQVDLYENTTVGDILYAISAFDPDSPSTQLFYKIADVQPVSIFTISYLTGEIYLTQALDYELHTSYNLIITVYDGEPSREDTKSSQLRLTAFIIDVNDNSPVCPHVITLHSTQETNASRELVAALNCSDRDSRAITTMRYFEVDTLYENYFEVTSQGDPPTWYLYFLPQEARASHNGSLFNAYFHNIKCCDGSSPELCTEMLVLVTTVDKPVPQLGLNATQLALAINTEGLENLITLFFNISHANWFAVVEHFKMLTANILTAFCSTNPFRCSILEDCSSERQSDWFDVDNVVIQDGYPVSTEDGTQLEIHFYVSLPDLPKDPEGATDYVVPGEVLSEIVSNRSDIFNRIISAIPDPTSCQNSKETIIYIIATFIIGVLFSMSLLILVYFICKLSNCCKDKANKVTSRKRVFPESERLRVSSIDYEMELRNMSAERTQEGEADSNMYVNPATSLNSGMNMGHDVFKVSVNSNEVEVDPNQNEVPKIKFTEEKEIKGKTPEDSITMNPFWETNPRFWSFQDKEVETEYCVTPLLSEASASARDTDSPITEYYSTDVSVFTSQTSLGQASTKALGKARGRYDLMELASMESLMEQNTTNKLKTSLRPESQNLVSSQTTSRSTMLYLPSTSSTTSNTSLQELPKCSTAINIDSQEYSKPLGQKNFTPKKAWDQD